MEAMIEEVRKQRGKASSGLLSEEDMQMRMVTRFINETSLCLQDGIITDPTAGGKLILLHNLYCPPSPPHRS
jgi:enoyl-CoA hydratase/long-chain 3-hydroxyacyl-CoA dehydrogenase